MLCDVTRRVGRCALLVARCATHGTLCVLRGLRGLWRCTRWRGVGLYGVAWCGVAWRYMVCCVMIWRVAVCGVMCCDVLRCVVCGGGAVISVVLRRGSLRCGVA